MLLRTVGRRRPSHAVHHQCAIVNGGIPAGRKFLIGAADAGVAHFRRIRNSARHGQDAAGSRAGSRSVVAGRNKRAGSAFVKAGCVDEFVAVKFPAQRTMLPLVLTPPPPTMNRVEMSCVLPAAY